MKKHAMRLSVEALNVHRKQVVYVRSYVRFRLGRYENVCAHTRGWPGGVQLTLNLH